MTTKEPAPGYSLTEAVLQSDGRSVLECSPLAQHYLPLLQPGQPLPPELAELFEGAEAAGLFSCAGRSYQFSLLPGPEERWLLRFTPAPQSALTDGQLGNAIRQMRNYLQDLIRLTDRTVHGEPGALDAAGINQALHRMRREIENLDFLQWVASGSTWYFSPRPFDLGFLCQDLSWVVHDALAGTQAKVTWLGGPPSLVVQGDEALLRRAILELVSNAALGMKGQPGELGLSLRHIGSHAVVTITGGRADSQAEKAAMLSGSAGMRVPLPHQGGFLGLSVVRAIAALHQGALLIQWLENDQCRVSLSVPIGSVVLSPDLELNTFLDRGDGVAPWMLWMADALPKEVYDWTQGG